MKKDQKNIYFQKEDSLKLLHEALKTCAASSTFSPDALEQNLRKHADELNVKAASLIHPIRLAISGRTATPGIFDVMELLGKAECIKRIQSAILNAESCKI